MKPTKNKKESEKSRDCGLARATTDTDTATGTSPSQRSSTLVSYCSAVEKDESNDNKPGSCPGQPVPGQGAALMGGDPDWRGQQWAGFQHPTLDGPQSPSPLPTRPLARLPACDTHNIGTGVSTFEAWPPRSL